MSDPETPQRKPSFHIVDPNPLFGNKALVVMNPEMTRGLCDFVEEIAERGELKDDEQYLYAFVKQIRRHYFRMRKMYAGSTEQEMTEHEEPVGA